MKICHEGLRVFLNADGGGGSSWQADDIPTGEQEFSYDASDTTAGDVGGPPRINKAGWYHLEIIDVVPDLKVVSDQGKEKSPSVRFKCVVQHSVPGQSPAGTEFEHRIFLAGAGGKPASDGSKRMALGFGLRIGLLEEITPAGEEKPRLVIAGTTDSNITSKTWLKAKGMHMIGEVKHTPAEGDFGEKYEFAYGSPYRPDSPFVEDIPKNVDVLKAVGYTNVKPGTVRAAPAAGAAGKAPATSKKAPAEPPKPAADPKPAPSAPAIDLSDL